MLGLAWGVTFVGKGDGGGPRLDLGEVIVVRGRAECGRVLLVGRCTKRPPHGGGPGAARRCRAGHC